jgi:hypothetical protein
VPTGAEDYIVFVTGRTIASIKNIGVAHFIDSVDFKMVNLNCTAAHVSYDKRILYSVIVIGSSIGYVKTLGCSMFSNAAKITSAGIIAV